MASTYQLHIDVPAEIEVQVGKLGRFRFPAGRYVYTGSAKRNLEARIARHRARTKKRRWHIDYLLTVPGVWIVDVELSELDECAAHQRLAGTIVAPGFGASDCRAGCGSHLLLVAT